MIIGVPLWAVLVAGVKHLRTHALRKKDLPTDEHSYENMDIINLETHIPINKDSGKNQDKNTEETQEDKNK